MTIRVMLADDERLVLTGFRMILHDEPDIEVVAEAADFPEAVTIAADVKPGVVLMNIRMPNLNGIEATRRIVASEIGVAMLISEHTARTHVARILTKLSLNDRTLCCGGRRRCRMGGRRGR
jgi:DNA-binding NarL/FixJ family response regulator